MNVKKNLVVYPIALAVAMAVGTASAQSVTNATLIGYGQSLGAAPLGLGDIYSKQGHALRGSSQRLPLVRVTLKDDYRVGDDILLTLSGVGMTPDFDRTATTGRLDLNETISCAATGGAFRIGHSTDTYIPADPTNPTQTIRLTVTQRDSTVQSTVDAQCDIEGLYITDASIAGADVTASAAGAQLKMSWVAYDG